MFADFLTEDGNRPFDFMVTREKDRGDHRWTLSSAIKT
jgi:hypothetical protein